MDVRNEPFKVPLESVRQEPKIEIYQEPFYLMEIDYYHLVKGRSKPSQFGFAVFLTSVGYLIILLAKLAATHLFSKPTTIETWEWLVVIIGALGGLGIYTIFTYCFSNDYGRINGQIKKHFEKSPRERKLAGGKNEQ